MARVILILIAVLSWMPLANGNSLLNLVQAPAPAAAAQEADAVPLRGGMRGQAVTDLQTKLNALGYPVGVIDGVYGQQTLQAVAKFQKDHSLEGESGVWLPDYNAALDASPDGNGVTPSAAGDDEPYCEMGVGSCGGKCSDEGGKQWDCTKDEIPCFHNGGHCSCESSGICKPKKKK